MISIISPLAKEISFGSSVDAVSAAEIFEISKTVVKEEL
jgi:hypothetical protein